MTGSRESAHFVRLYQSNPDPWNFKTSAYEQAKYRHTLEVLANRRFASGLEAGCSIGVLTRMLASLCGTLLAVDIAEPPLRTAAAYCAGQPWVRFQRMRMPDEWPDQRFDLIVLSEVLYFLSPADIDRCARHTLDSFLPGARVLLVNWLGQSDDPCSGDQAADRFIAATAETLTIVRQDRRQEYRLDLLEAP